MESHVPLRNQRAAWLALPRSSADSQELKRQPSTVLLLTYQAHPVTIHRASRHMRYCMFVLYVGTYMRKGLFACVALR